MKILLIGNPNVGKTTLFNALTGAHERTGNYHGVTVGVTERTIRRGILAGMTVVDLPGIYTLDGYTGEEKIADEYIERTCLEEDLIAVQVVDGKYLDRSLALTAALIGKGIVPVLAISADKLRAAGGSVDLAATEKSTGLKCFEVNALKKRSVRAFAAALAGSLKHVKRAAKKERINLPLKAVWEPPQKTDGGLTDKLLVNPFFALPFFLTLLLGVFYLTFGRGMPGTIMRDFTSSVIDLFAEMCGAGLRSPLLKGLVADGFIRGVGSVLSFIPQIALMYFFLDLLEESGFMSVLAYCTDALFSPFGLSGRAAFSFLMGFGCTAAAISSTAALESDRERGRTVFGLFFLPCSAKLPVYVTLLSSLFNNVFLGAVLLYVIGVAAGLLAAAIHRDKDGVFFMEIADICFPPMIFVIKKLLFQIKQFIIKVSTAVLLFTVSVWCLSRFSFRGMVPIEESFLADISKGLGFLFYPMGITDWRAAFAAVGGIIAKENIAGTLALLYPNGLTLAFPSACAYLVFISLIPPCISALMSSAKEIGLKKTCLYATEQTLIAFFVAYLVFAFLKNRSLLPIFAAVIAAAFGAHRIKKSIKNKTKGIT